MTACVQWGSKVAAYADGELPRAEASAFRAHAATCPGCATAALAIAEQKAAVRRAANCFAPPHDLQERVRQSLHAQPKLVPFAPRRSWMLPAVAAAALLLVALGLTALGREQQRRSLNEFADLHVAALASSHPVEVISTDRHTVKPWFQGRIPFSFNLPELAGTPYTLTGGSVAYFHGEPGAHLLFAYQRHFLSVFIFQENAVAWPGWLAPEQANTFNLRSWNSGPLRFVVVSDAGADTIDQLCNLLKQAQ